MLNTISGTGGNDFLTGRDRETWWFIEINDGIDSIDGWDGDDTLLGLGENDTLSGGLGNDRLDGGMGNDYMLGGGGNDTYVVDNSLDTVTELYQGQDLGGFDTVESAVNFRLGVAVENLTLIGSASWGAGNDLNNTIRGNAAINQLEGLGGSDQIFGGSGNDTLDGGESFDYLSGESGSDRLLGGNGNDFLDGGLDSDTMIGGNGNDYYVIDSITDLIDEQGEGYDSAYSSVNITLFNNVEHLTLTGSAVVGVGNGLDNTLVGNNLNNRLSGRGGDDYVYGEDGNDFIAGDAGNDHLIGGAGNDWLTGDPLFGAPSSGYDRFYYETDRSFLRQDIGIDNITDFVSGVDKIVLSKDTFITLSSNSSTCGVVGFSNPSEFGIVNSDEAAASSSAEIVYNSTNGKLFYNPNGRFLGFDIGFVGSNLPEGGHFITLQGAPNLSANDFVVSELPMI